MKRVIVRSALVTAVLGAAFPLSAKINPWPSLTVVTYVLSFGERQHDAALQKRVPSGIAARFDISYGRAKDEVLDVYYRTGSRPRPAIVWVHGGAFVSGSKNNISNYLRILASHGYTTIAVEYSKGPGTTYPKPIQQVNAALGFIARHAAELNVDSAGILLAGDSAGAHIASQLALLITNPEYAHAVGIVPQLKPAELAATLLLSGVYDPAALNLSGTYGWFNETVFSAYSGLKNYREDERFRLTSISRYVTGNFPQTFISSGNGDPLAPQAVALADRLREVGVRVDSLFFSPDRNPSLWHEYQFNLDEPAGEEALRRICAFLNAIEAS